jgi:hypothetical protein
MVVPPALLRATAELMVGVAGVKSSAGLLIGAGIRKQKSGVREVL